MSHIDLGDAGISQRDVTQRFEFLAADKDELQEALLEFHEDHIMAGFPLWDCELPGCVALGNLINECIAFC
jgi:D123